MDYFKDRVAIVTGGASGIGRALCEELGRRGAVVIVADINIQGAQEVASSIAGADGSAAATHVDVSQEDSVQQLVADTVSEHGKLDFMFNNAGIGIAGEFRDLTAEHWRSVIDVNLWGVINGSRAAYSLMVKQGFGHIVNTSSLAGVIPVPMLMPYCTTKWAVVGFTNSLRIEGAALGIKATVACPGWVQSPIFETSDPVNLDREKALAKLPQKKMNPTNAACIILRGVARNQATIIFPFEARFWCWLYRFQPALMAMYARKVVKEIRRARLQL